MMRGRRAITTKWGRERWRDLTFAISCSLALLATGIFAACGDEQGSAVTKGDVLAGLRVHGIDVGMASQPPISFLDESGEPAGIYPDEFWLIMRRLGITDVRARVVDFAALVPALAANRFDAVAGGLYVLPERCRSVIFSEPNIAALEAFMVRAGNPRAIETYDDVARLPDARLGLVSGTAEVRLAEAAGVRSPQMVMFPDVVSALSGLEAGRVDAVGYDNLSLGTHEKRMDGYEVTPPYRPVIDGKPQVGYGAVAFPKGSEALRDAYNAELRKLRESGELARIGAKYGATEENYELATTQSTGELCKG